MVNDEPVKGILTSRRQTQKLEKKSRFCDDVRHHVLKCHPERLCIFRGLRKWNGFCPLNNDW